MPGAEHSPGGAPCSTASGSRPRFARRGPTWCGSAPSEVLAPDIRLERLRGSEELRALLRPEDWAALDLLTRE